MAKQELTKIGLQLDTKEEAFAEAELHKNCFVIEVTWEEGFKIWYLYRMEEFDECVKTIEEGINDGFVRKAEFFYFNNIKGLFEKLEELERKTNELDKLMEENPYNEEIENAFDEAYKKEWEVFNKLIDEVVKFTKGKIDRKQAYNMIQSKRSELKSIIEMM